MTGPDCSSHDVMAASPQGSLLADAQEVPPWASLSSTSCSSSASSSPSGKARFGSALHSPGPTKRLGGMPYCGAMHSPRDLHPIKYFLTSADVDGHSADDSVGRRRSSATHRRHRRRQMKQNSCTHEELADMAGSPKTADDFGRSKSEGKYCQRPLSRTANPILAELQRLEGTDTPDLEPFGRSQSEPAGPTYPGSPSPSPGPSPGRAPLPYRHASNPIMQELERLERRDSAHLNVSAPWGEQKSPVYLSHQGSVAASILGGRPARINSPKPWPRPASSHGASPIQTGSNLASEGLLPRVSHSGATSPLACASPMGEGSGLPQGSAGNSGLVTAASLDGEAQRRRGGNPIMLELERLERLERQSSWAGASWERQRVLPSARGRGTPFAFRNHAATSSEYFGSPAMKGGFESEPRVHPRAPSGPVSSVHRWTSASEEPSFESLRVIRHRRSRPILHDLDLSFLTPGVVGTLPRVMGPLCNPSPGPSTGAASAVQASGEGAREGAGAAGGARSAVPEASAGLPRGSAEGSDEAQRGMGGGEEETSRSQVSGEPQGAPQASIDSSLQPKRSLSLSRALRPLAWAEDSASSAGGLIVGGLIPEDSAPAADGQLPSAAPPRATGSPFPCSAQVMGASLEPLDECLGLLPFTALGASAFGPGVPVVHPGSRLRGTLGRSLLGKGVGAGQGESAPRACDSGPGMTQEPGSGAPQAASGEAQGSRGGWGKGGSVKSASAGAIPLDRPQSTHQGLVPDAAQSGVSGSSATAGAGGATTGSDAATGALGAGAGAGAGSAASRAAEGSGTPKACMPAQPRTSRFLFRMKSAQLA